MVTINSRTEEQVSAMSLQPGGEWGNFTLARRIGEGSSAEVYLAHDSWLGHDVALDG